MNRLLMEVLNQRAEQVDPVDLVARQTAANALQLAQEPDVDTEARNAISTLQSGVVFAGVTTTVQPLVRDVIQGVRFDETLRGATGETPAVFNLEAGEYELSFVYPLYTNTGRVQSYYSLDDEDFEIVEERYENQSNTQFRLLSLLLSLDTSTSVSLSFEQTTPGSVELLPGSSLVVRKL